MYNISGEKECDKFGNKMLVSHDSEPSSRCRNQVISFLSENKEEDNNIKIMEFSYYLFVINMIECICMKIYDFFYYIKNREL